MSADEIERIRALWRGVYVDDADRERDVAVGCCAWWERPGAPMSSETVEARWWDAQGRERALGAPAHIEALLAALDASQREAEQLRGQLTAMHRRAQRAEGIADRVAADQRASRNRRAPS